MNTPGEFFGGFLVLSIIIAGLWYFFVLRKALKKNSPECKTEFSPTDVGELARRFSAGANWCPDCMEDFLREHPVPEFQMSELFDRQIILQLIPDPNTGVITIRPWILPKDSDLSDDLGKCHEHP